MELNLLSKRIIGAVISVHKELGPGLLESAYQECLAYELRNAGLLVKKELALPIEYKGLKLDHGYRIDLLVNETVVLELKTVEALSDVHFAQILTYLKLGNYPLGLLVNFYCPLVTNGIRRVINKPL